MNKFYFLLLLVSTLCRGQDSLSIVTQKNILATSFDTSYQKRTVSKNYLRKDVWRVDFLAPGYLNEHRIGRQITLVSQVQLLGSFRVEDRFEGYGFNYTAKRVLTLSINPEVSVAVRHFYNLPKRKKTNKSLRYNSGSYFAARTGYVLPPIFKNSYLDTIHGLGISGLWGVQQTYRKHLYINLELGVGVAQYYKNRVSPTGTFMLGYTL